MNTIERNLLIAGGGASGIAAAVFALEILPGAQIALIEKNQMLGRKLAATGNGKCNFSNRDCGKSQYNKSAAALIEKMLEKMPPESISLFLEKLGVFSREDSEGRFYPYSEQAASVKEAFETELFGRGVDCFFNTEVIAAEEKGGNFYVRLGNGTSIKTKALLLATGGKAGTAYGCDGSGYKLAKAFGHSVASPHPALVQVTSPEPGFKEWKGVRAKGSVELWQNGKMLASENGEIQFTESGLSGICIFDLSRHWPEKNEGLSVLADLFSGFTEQELTEKLIARKEYLSERTAGTFLDGMLNKKLIPGYLKRWDIDPKASLGTLSVLDMKTLSSVLKSWEIKVDGTKGWAEAQVTAGGIKVTEIDKETMESKIIPGLFFAGELIDVDGSCGGRNLQWAFSSGAIAGHNAAMKNR